MAILRRRLSTIPSPSTRSSPLPQCGRGAGGEGCPSPSPQLPSAPALRARKGECASSLSSPSPRPLLSGVMRIKLTTQLVPLMVQVRCRQWRRCRCGGGGGDDDGKTDGRGEKNFFTPTVHPLALIPSIPSVGVDPFHPVDTVDTGNTGEPIDADGGDTNDIDGAAPVGENMTTIRHRNNGLASR